VRSKEHFSSTSSYFSSEAVYSAASNLFVRKTGTAFLEIVDERGVFDEIS